MKSCSCTASCSSCAAKHESISFHFRPHFIEGVLTFLNYCAGILQNNSSSSTVALADSSDVELLVISADVAAVNCFPITDRHPSSAFFSLPFIFSAWLLLTTLNFLDISWMLELVDKSSEKSCYCPCDMLVELSSTSCSSCSSSDTCSFCSTVFLSLESYNAITSN